jgi:Nucleotidyltransferase of unknown function (DUF6036)
MNAFEAARRIGDLLEADGIEYAIGGALALGVWGVPRGTKDVDLSVFVDPDNLDGMFAVFERAGIMFDRAAAARNVERTGLLRGLLGRIPVDAFISRHPQFLEMRTRRQRVATPDGGHLYFITAEDLCVMKLVYGRDKDVTDLERLFAVRSLDVDYVRTWLAKMPVGPDRREILDDLARRFAR